MQALDEDYQSHKGRSVKDIMDIEKFHAQGYKGKGIKIAILDSGLGQDFQQTMAGYNAHNNNDATMNIVQIIDFTNDKTAEQSLKATQTGEDLESEDDEEERIAVDENGHGTFVAGLIGSQNPKCPGIAPETEIYILKLFNEDEMTYSAWFLDAFNFVLENDIDIVNLSTASKDTKDNPFIEKIEELTAAGIIVVSAIGNDGPT